MDIEVIEVGMGSGRLGLCQSDMPASKGSVLLRCINRSCQKEGGAGPV